MTVRKSTTIVGVQELFYATISEEVVSGVTVSTYGSPKRLGYVQELSVAPQVETAQQYGDNMVIESATAMGNIEVEMSLTGIEPEVEAEVLGHEYKGGAVVKKSTDVAPFIALLYKRTKANGTSRFVVLYKGSLALPEEANKTKEDSVEFQSSEFTASFMPRPDDKVYQFTFDEDEAVEGSIGATWVDPLDADYWMKNVVTPDLDPSATVI